METLPGCLHRCPCYLETLSSFAVTLVDETVTPGAFSKTQELLPHLCMQDHCLRTHKGQEDSKLHFVMQSNLT